MALYVDSISLLDRTVETRTLVDSDVNTYATNGIKDGDLTPWRIRLELVNTAEDGVDNSGNIKLRIDEAKTFIKTGPLLMDEDAKTKYLIEAKITQTIGGSSVEGKVFMFQIGTPSISVDKNQGAILSIQLQEIQRRTQEVYSSRELRFFSPKQALRARIDDFQNFERDFNSPTGNKPVTIKGHDLDANNKLPVAPRIEYVPQSAVSIKQSVEQLINNLSQAQVQGGVFTDFYYDYDPDTSASKSGNSGKPLTTWITADAIGEQDTGVILNPLSAEAIDAEQQQDVNTNFFRYRNHVIGRGAPNTGSLPTEHSVYSSNWLHAKLRPEFSSTSTVTGRDGVTYKYLQGDVVKRTFTLPSFTSTDEDSAMPPTRRKTVKAKNLIRFFVARKNITSPYDPEDNVTDWREDFVIYPEFDRTGHYTKGDIIYYKYSGSTVRFYQATEDIYDWSIGRFRENHVSGSTWSFPANNENASNYTTKHLKTNGFIKNPNESNSGFRACNTLGTDPDGDANTVTDHTPHIASDGSSWTEHQGFSPWTSDIFDWEKNMVGLKAGSLPRAQYGGKRNKTTGTGTPNRYIGMMPDWNITKDVYEKQDDTNEFENITAKWVTAIQNAPPTDAKEVYHGARYMVGKNPTGAWANKENRLAQYVYDPKGETAEGTGWRFSKEPEDGDIFQNLDDARTYQWDTSRSPDSWIVAWKVARTDGTVDQTLAYDDNVNRDVSPATPFHIVKDMYKTAGFEGTPNSAVEVRYAWDVSTGLGTNPTIVGGGQGGGSHTVGQLSDIISMNSESKLCRKNSRGLWLWFWNPFPRLGHADNVNKTGYLTTDVQIGDKYGGNGSTPEPKNGFTTLNIYNNNTDRHQSTQGWNNGLKSEDMGKISSLTFKIKVGIYAQPVDNTNDDYFWELDPAYLVVGEAEMPFSFWAVDMFDRVWRKKFTVRKNGYWSSVTIDFGDMSAKNLYIPRFDELSQFFGRPLGFTNYALQEKEFTGVGFDWRFVRGWGLQWDGAYDVNGYYNAGLDYWMDLATQAGEQIKQIPHNTWAVFNNWLAEQNVEWDGKPLEKMPMAYAIHGQATVAIDNLHYDKELTVNSDDEFVKNARTSSNFHGNISDYITLKAMSKSQRERESFYPQFWNLRSIGDVRMRVGKSFKVKGDRMPNMTDMIDPDDGSPIDDWVYNNNYSHKQRVKYNGYVYQAIVSSNQNHQPDTSPTWWTNLNELACAEVRHIIDHTGYHMEVQGRRKFIVTGDD